MTAVEEVPGAAADVVAAYVTERTGLSVEGPRRTHLLQQIDEAMARVGATSGEWYRARIEEDEDFFDDLVARVTVGESYFFREPGQLEVVRSTILPERRAVRGQGAALRLWSAGCAIGQEAYTLAMLLEEEGLTDCSSIVATDLSRAALRVARAGVYGSWSLRAVTDRQRATYFQAVATGYRVDERLGRSITFRPLNLVDLTDRTPGDIDVILCRNVLIYFAPEVVALAAQRLTAALAPGGWLVTGASDPPLEGIADLEPTPTAAGLVYRRTTGARRTHAVPAGAVQDAVVTPCPSPPLLQAPPAVVRPVSAVPPTATKELSGDEAVRAVRALGGAGDLTGALDTAADAIARLPLHSELRVLEAVVLMEAGRPVDAARSARAALYLDPELTMAHLMLARAEVALGHRTQARRNVRNALARLAVLPADAPVPLSDGQPAGRLAAMAAAYDRALAEDLPAGAGDSS